MYDGFFEVFIGILCLVVSFFRKNKKDENASFLRKYNKQILIICGFLMIAIGTMSLIKSLQ